VIEGMAANPLAMVMDSDRWLMSKGKIGAKKAA
jgi:hypothetical protein